MKRFAFFLPLLSAALLPAQSLVFSDSFERPDSDDVNASVAGITDNTSAKFSASGAYTENYHGGGASVRTNIGGAGGNAGNDNTPGVLFLADGTGTSNIFLNHNFIDAEILAAGGFRMTVEVSPTSTIADAGQGAAFAIGMTEAEAIDTGDAMEGGGSSDGNRKMQDGINGGGNTDVDIAASDFWIVLRGDGNATNGSNLLVWGGAGNTVDQTNPTGLPGQNASVPGETGTIAVDFRFTDFQAGSEVAYEIFFNDASIATGTFTWSDTGSNYLGLDGRGSYIGFEEIAITTVGAANPVANLEVSPATVSPDDTAAAVELSWAAGDYPPGATYRITADQAVTFPNGDNTGTAAAAGTVSAIVDGSAGDTTFTFELLDGSEVIATATAKVLQQRPNVLLIMLDDMGWSDFGCYGSEIRTPHIDALAANGIKYRNFYNTARCSTTRCALLSGLYTQQAAVDPGASLPNLRTDNNLSIAELLSTTGYRRYMTGKWHLGTNDDRSPIGRGFQHVFGQTSGGNFPHNQVSGGNQDSFWNEANFGFYSENGEIPVIDYPNYNLNTDTDTHPPGRFHYTDAIGDYALSMIDHHLAKQDGAPFFLYMPFNAVHWDINAPADMADRYTDVGDPTPDGLSANGGADGGDYFHYEDGWEQARAARFDRQLTLGARDNTFTLSPKSPAINSNGTNSPTPPLVDIPDWNAVSGGDARRDDLARRMALYAAMLEQVDNNIQRVIDRLEEDNLLENTIIFILADNGGNYEGGLYGKTDGVQNAAPVTGFPDLRNMGQPSNPDLHIGGGWANVANTPFRLYKHYQHEGGIRTPCIIHYPAAITSPGRWIDDRCHLIDIMATIAEVTRTPFPATWPGKNLLPLEGQSLVPHFKPETVASFPARGLGFEHESNRARIKGDYKFVTKNFAYLDGSSPADELELYDLSTDPTELHNLATEQPQLLAEYVAEWNAWATHVGVLPGRLLTPPVPQVDPAPLPNDLFLDTFNRGDNPNHDAETTGMSGLLLPSLAPDATYFDSWEAGSTEVNGLSLRMAAGSGMTETALRHNFIDPEITNAGGFAVQIRIDAISSDGSDDENRFAGIAVGLTAGEAASSNDVSATNPPLSFRGRTNNANGSADFFIDLALDGNLRCWSNGNLLQTVNVGQVAGDLLVCYETSSFAAGELVTVTAFLDGRTIDLDPSSNAETISFQWENSDANHIGLSARAVNQVTLDNFAIRTLPLDDILATNHAVAAGLSGADSAPDNDADGDGDSNYLEWLRNGDPAANDTGSRLLSLAPSAGGVFRFNLIRLKNAAKAGVQYSFRYTTDLGVNPSSWPTFQPEEISGEDFGENHRIQLLGVPASLVSANQRLFILIDVTRLEPN